MTTQSQFSAPWEHDDPAGPSKSESFLLIAAHATTLAIYIATLTSDADLRRYPAWLIITCLFALFHLSLFILPHTYPYFWRRVALIIAQIVLLFTIMWVGRGHGSLPILGFIIVPVGYLSFNFGQATIFTLACLAAIFLNYVLLGEWREGVLNLLIFGGGFAFFAAASTAMIQQRKAKQQTEQLLAELETAHRQLQAYATQIEALAVTEERNRLAREIHDSLGHYLTVITMQLEAAQKLIASQPERAVEVIAKAEQLSRESLSEVRRSVAALRTAPIDATPLGQAIEQLTEHLRESGLVTTYTMTGEPYPLSIQARTALYRAAQEGLTNIRKHARASAVEITLAYQAGAVALTLADNGLGTRAEPQGEPHGFGLLGLRERVSLLGGTLETSNQPGGGFRLHVTLPRAEGGEGQGQGDV